MHGPIPSCSSLPAAAELQLRRARTDFLRTSLEVGLTLLDVAELTGETLRRHRCVLRAISALDTVQRHFGDLPIQIQDIRPRYEELVERLVRAVNDDLPEPSTHRLPLRASYVVKCNTGVVGTG